MKRIPSQLVILHVVRTRRKSLRVTAPSRLEWGSQAKPRDTPSSPDLFKAKGNLKQDTGIPSNAREAARHVAAARSPERPGGLSDANSLKSQELKSGEGVGAEAFPTALGVRGVLID